MVSFLAWTISNSNALQHYQKYKKFQNEKTKTSAVRRQRLRRNSITQVHTHDANEGFTVSSKIGGPTKLVSVTYAEY